MSVRRKSKRTSAVTKGRLLEEKLEKRRIKSQERAEKARLKQIQHSTEEEAASKENLAIENQLADNFDEEDQGDKSLEWDHSEETPPSFLNDTWDSNKAVEEIIEEINIEEPLEISDTDKESALDNKKFRSRAKTSTDNAFLDVAVEPIPPLNLWPPRFPSQEPEFNPLLHSSLAKAHHSLSDIDSEEGSNTVFDESDESDPEEAAKNTKNCIRTVLTERFENLLNMEETIYKERLRVIRLESRKVRNKISAFLPDMLTNMDTSNYVERLKDIRDQLELYEDTVSNLVLDLEDQNQEDERVGVIENEQAKLRNEVVENEQKVKVKIEELLASKPMSKAEQEALDLKRTKLDIEKKKDAEQKALKTKKAMIDINLLMKRAKELSSNIEKVDETSKLSDQDVRRYMLESKRWEADVKELVTTKGALDKDLLSTEGLEQESTDLKNVVDAAISRVEMKIKELTLVDKEKCLYSLSKPVKEVHIYPPPFSGKPGENVFKFIEKMKIAMTANQIAENNKIEVLKKHLRGSALNSLGANESYESFDKALDILKDHHRQTQDIWTKLKEEYMKICNNPARWSSLGSYDRKWMITKTCDFLREGESLAKDYPELADHVYNVSTPDDVMQLCPENINIKILEEIKLEKLANPSATFSAKDKFRVVKKVMEDQLQLAIIATESSKALKYSASAHNVQSKAGHLSKAGHFKKNKLAYQNQSLDNKHDCARSYKCNKDWAGLGCVKLYELATVEERREFLKERSLCYKCGQPAQEHDKSATGRFSYYGRCDDKSFKAALPVRCTKESKPGVRCTLSVATCDKHPPDNASKELIDWLHKNRIKSTIASIFIAPALKDCNVNKNHPQSTKMDKSVRLKLQSGTESRYFSNEQLRELFAKDLKVSQEKVSPMPEGEVSFIFAMIKGKNKGIQTFIDSGCNCAIFRDGVPQTELNSCKLQDGPIPIDIATGVSVNALGEWASSVPLANGSYQVVRALTVKQVTANMTKLYLRPTLNDLKNEASAKNIKELQKIQVPECLGGEIDMILGIQFASIHPEPVFSMPNGLTVYKSKFAPVKNGEIACLGGPLDAIHRMVTNAGARKAVSYMSNLINMASSEYSPRIDFFPSYDQEFDRNIEKFTDKGIPQISEYIEMIKAELEEEESLDEESLHDEEEYCEESNELVDEEDNIVDYSNSSQYDEVVENRKCSEETPESNEEENVFDVKVQENNHSTRIQLKSNEFLVSQGKLGKVCPIGTCTGYALFDCDERCENAAEEIKLKYLRENLDNESLKEENVKTCSECGIKENKSNKSHTVQGEMKRFFDQQEAGLDSSFRCLRCRDCRECLKGAGQERMSMIQEAQQQLIRQSVSIDHEEGKATAKLPFLTDPAGKLLDNSRMAEKRLESVCKKYSSDVEVKEKINAAFKKLLDKGHIVMLDDLPKELGDKIKAAKPSYTIPFDVAFKEESVSTPARPVFDASSKTPGGYSLNDLLAKGQPDMVRLVDMVLDWRMGKSALTGDIRQFYNTINLHEDHWQFQKILLKENLDIQNKTVVAIIKTLIYGVRPVGNQCEEIIKLLAEEIKEEFPEVYALLVLKRYVDDFGKSTGSKEETDELIQQTTSVLARIKMEIKGWTVAGLDPPEQLSEDGVSVGFAGATWFPKGDFFKLNIQSLHFGKKKRGKFPPNLRRFDKCSGISIDEFTPQEITRTNCTSVTARIFDISGLLAPLLLKLKSDLRRLITFEPSWKQPIPEHQRAIWVNNFKIIEDVRDILYVRCSIPADAVSPVARILLLADAADDGIIFAAYVGYLRKCGEWSCDLLFGKGLLAPENWTIPQKELHGLSAVANLKPVLENSLGSWVDRYYAFSDSEIAICWSIYDKVKLTTFVRNRVINIRTKLGLDILHHVDGKNNPCDTGTRPELITAESVKPGSLWMTGAAWMRLSIEKATESGVIKSAGDIKLSNDEKKVFKKELVYDTFEEENLGTFAVKKAEKLDKNEIQERLKLSKYIYPPLKRSFKSTVRIIALVMVASRKFKKLLVLKQIERKEKAKDALKELDFQEQKFTVFNIQDEGTGLDVKTYRYCHQTNNWSTENWSNNEAKFIRLTDEQLSAAQEYLFKKATKEVFLFNKIKDIEKIAVMQDGILYSKSRLLEAAEVKAVGHIADSIDMETFTGVNFKVPLIDQHSPLAISIALYLHYEKYPHRGAETLHRLSLQHCKILKGRQIFTNISHDCSYCRRIGKKLAEQMMGPLSFTQTTLSPVFYFTLVDLWGPLASFVPGYEKVTRSTADKPHDVYMLVFACCATGTINCQVIEGRKTGFCLDGFTRFFCETAVPKIIYSDEEGGLTRSLAHGEIDLIDLSGTLSRQKGIEFVTVVPQGHSSHGRIERRIQLLQKSLEQSNIRNSRCTATGWQTIAKLLEHTVNSIPIGFLHHQTGGINNKLRILTPNSLKLVTTSDRAPVGLFDIPSSPTQIMDNIAMKYEAWYRVWNDEYLPLIMERQKWHFSCDNFQPDDIVYFKITESKMSAVWRLGKVVDVKVGQDGFVREATVSYKDVSSDDPADWITRTVNRPVRNMVKLFKLEDTTIMEDIKDVHDCAQKILDKKKLSFVPPDNEESETKGKPGSKKTVKFKETDDKIEDLETKVEADDQNEEGNLAPPTKPQVQDKKPRKKRKTELENLEIKMKNWSSLNNKEREYFYKTKIDFLGPPTLEEVQEFDVPPSNYEDLSNTPFNTIPEPDMFEDFEVGPESYKHEEAEMMLGW